MFFMVLDLRLMEIGCREITNFFLSTNVEGELISYRDKEMESTAG
jgi:hypothetical protein